MEWYISLGGIYLHLFENILGIQCITGNILQSVFCIENRGMKTKVQSPV